MDDVELARLSDRLAEGSSAELRPGARLVVAPAPQPFIAPPITQRDTSAAADPLRAEVVIISSPAAVGKSTIARKLSSDGALPLLDLAKVAVSTHTLAGLLASDFAEPEFARESFLRGEMALLIDALDEGRLRSGDSNLEQFLETTWELLLSDRSVPDRPKLVFLGREGAAEIVDLSIELQEKEISVAWVRLGFFKKDAAAALVEAYASTTAAEDNKTWSPSGLTREVVEAFFAAIAGALSLHEDELWDDDQGQALAGYAPVLAAIGRLLARESNPIRLKNALEGTGAARAWDVIERVASEILDREHEEKIRPQLERMLSEDAPVEAYDRYEQLTYLAQKACNRPIHPTSRVRLAGRDAEIYRRMVDQHLPDHPFLQNGELANEVLASLVLAHAVFAEILEGDDLQVLRRASRQPFLWRSVRQRLSGDGPELLPGEYVGSLFTSMWNDPVLQDARVQVRNNTEEPGFLSVSIKSSDGECPIQISEPLEFYGEARDCDVDVEADVVLQGHRGPHGVAAFDLAGKITLVVRGTLIVDAAAVRITGETRIFAASIQQPSNLALYRTEPSQTWWGGELADVLPWRDIASDLPAPIETRPSTDLERLVEQCVKRIPRGAPIVVYENTYEPAARHKMKWLDHAPKGDLFPELLRLFVSMGVARADNFGASGPDPKLRLHFDISWTDLSKALRLDRVDDPVLQKVADEARALFAAR